MRLKATTLLETVVSSLVFMIVFAVAMSAIPRINRISHPDWAAMERDFNACRDSVVTREPGTYAFKYPWGVLSFEKKEAGRGLMEVTATASMKSTQKIVYRYLSDE